MLAKDKNAGTTVINHHCDQSGDRAEGVSSELWRPPQKDGNTRGGKRPFWGENAELKNTALKRRDGCSASRCMSDRNYPSLYSAIRMRIRGSETHTAGQASGGGEGGGGRLEFHGSDLSPACREDVWTAEEGK